MSGTGAVLPVSRVGPFRIERRIGAGGMGVVYLGHHERTGVAAAVKLLKPDFVADRRFRERLRREVLAAGRVPRSCTAQLLGADLDADPPWLATEYIAAPSLEVVLLERGRLSAGELPAFAVGVAIALREIHRRGVVHRDLKPSNIMLSPHGPRVIDFGIARVEGPDFRLTQLTPTGAVIGTPAYLAPEQLRAGRLTPAVDVFAWGALVVHAATGAPPVRPDHRVRGARPAPEPDLGQLSEPLRGLVAAALHKRPGARPTAAELVERLQDELPQVTTRVLASAAASPEAAVTAVPRTVAATSVSWSRRRVLVAAAAVAGAAVGGPALRWWLSDQDGPLGASMSGACRAVDSVAVGEIFGEPVVVCAGRYEESVPIWQLATGAEVAELPTGSQLAVRSVAVSRRRGVPVAVLGGAGHPSVQVWDLERREPADVAFTDDAGEVYSGAVSAVAVHDAGGSPIVVSGGFDRTLRVWDLSTGAQLGEPYYAYQGTDRPTVALTVAVGELDGAPIAVAAGSDQPPWALVWDLRTGEQIGALAEGHTDRISALAVGEADGTPVVVSGSYDHTVRVWEPTTGRQVGPDLSGHSRYVRTVAVTELAGTPVAVSGGNDRTVRVWDLGSGEQLGPALTGHTGDVTALAVSELAGDPIAISAGGHNDGTLRRWRLPDLGGDGRWPRAA